MKASLTASGKRLRSMILGFVLLLLVFLTIWGSVIVTNNLSPIFEAIGKRDRFNWWIPTLPQMYIAIR
jgi:Ca2+/Na+ antiporter